MSERVDVSERAPRGLHPGSSFVVLNGSSIWSFLRRPLEQPVVARLPLLRGGIPTVTQ